MKKFSLIVSMILCSCTPNAQNDAGVIDDAGSLNDAGLLVGPPQSIERDAQRSGDAARGFDLLLNGGYVGCGIPDTAFDAAFGDAPENQRVPGREGPGQNLAYNYNRYVTESGVSVTTANCLTCHASFLEGELFIGLGNASADFTGDSAAGASLARFLLSDPTELQEFDKWLERTETVAPFLRTKSVGVNPADALAAVLFAHRDRDTLAWSASPLLELPPLDPVPVDVPPWWRMKKKSTLYYTAGGRGDHARLMMTASALCVDSVEIAESIDAYFPDIQAYIESIEAPVYSGVIDAEQAALGEVIFENRCSECHGTYGDIETYPNVWVPSGSVGTDSRLAQSYADNVYNVWLNDSFYGQAGGFIPEDGYAAPPLDGIWATAPFLHNGSVPTLQALLKSDARPQFWRGAASTFDEEAVGIVYESLSEGQASAPEADRKFIYDTTNFGYGNAGHTYGDSLSEDERRSLLEYLKTL